MKQIGEGAPPASSRRRWLVMAICALLPIASLPLEFGQGDVGLGGVLLAALLVVAVREGAFAGVHLSMTVVEKVLGVLVFWVTARNFFIAPIGGEGFNAGFAIRETALLIGALAAYRLAQLPHVTVSLVRGFGFALAIALGIEAYQVIVGGAHLLAQGYSPDSGYFYATAEGGFRPFGTFSGPTTFGTFLAMLGGFVALSASTTTRRWAVALAVVVGVFATQTRAAMLGGLAAVALLVLLTSRARRIVGAIIIPASLTLIALFLARPGLWTSLTERMLSATEQTDTSRITRLQLWQGVMQVTTSEGRLLDGFAATPWLEVMSGEVGVGVASLGHAHSNFFQMWFRYGAIGAALFAALCVAILIVARRSYEDGHRYATSGVVVAVIYIFDSIFNNSLSSINFTLTAFLLVGIAVSRQRDVKSPPSGSERAGDEVVEDGRGRAG